MKDAYEMRDYKEKFEKESSSSVHMKPESRDNTTEAYLKELKRRADEATRKAFTDKLSDRIKELNEVLNTKALEEMVLFIDNRPIKLKEINFANMKKNSETMNDSLGNAIGLNNQTFAVQSVNPDSLKSDVSEAFASYGTQDSSIGEVSSATESEPISTVSFDDMSKGSNYFESVGNLPVGEVSSFTEQEHLPGVIGEEDNTGAKTGDDFFAQGGDLSVGEVSSVTEQEPLPAVNSDDMSKGSSYFKPAEDLPVGEVVSGTEQEHLPGVIGEEDNTGAKTGDDFFAQGGDLPANAEVIRAIDDYVDGHIGPIEDTSSSDMSSDETTEIKSSDTDDNNEKGPLSDSQLKEKIAHYIGAQPTEDGYTFPAATIPDENPKDVIRGGDVQVVPEREDTSGSAEIGYADIGSQIDESFAEKTSGDVSDSLDADSSNDNIFGDDQNKDTPVYESSDMSSTVNIEATNGSESFESSHGVDPDLGELIGYSKPEGGIDYFSLVPDVMRQFEEAKQNVARLNAEKAEKARKEAESAKNVHTLESEVGDKVRRLFQNTAYFERQGSELAGQIDSIKQNIANNEQVASMLLGVSSQLDAMLEESTDVDENVGVKQKK